jgi:hypothetical protein
LSGKRKPLALLLEDALVNRKLLSVTPQPLKKVLLSLIFILCIFAPAAYILYFALSSGELSRDDYWFILPKIYSINGFSTDISSWFSRANDHVIFIPNVIYALNIVVTHGSNIGLTLVGWLFALIQAVLLIRFLPRAIWDSRIIALILVFSVAVFVFTPSAAYNWAAGYAGIQFNGANTFAVASIACLTYFSRDQRPSWAVGSLLLALTAVLTHGMALALLPALCVGVALMRSRVRFIILYVAFTIVVYVAYFLTYQHPSYQPEPVYDKMNIVALYVITFLGGIFTKNVAVAMPIGTIGLLASALLAGLFLFRSATEVKLAALPWLLVQVYAIGDALIVAVSRAGYGVEQAIASRYASQPALFWVGVIVMAIYFGYCSISEHRRYRFIPVLVAIAVLVGSMYRIGISYAKEPLHKVSLQPLVGLSAQLEIPDENLVQMSIIRWPATFLSILPILKAQGLVPFNVEGNPCGKVDQKIASHLVNRTPQDDVLGYFDFLDQFVEEGARAVGWVYGGDRQVKCIVLLNQDNTVRGFGLPKFSRPDVAQVFGLPDQDIGWVGYVRVPSRDEELTAYVLFAGDERWVPLRNSHSLEKPGKVELSIYRYIIY